MKPLPESCSRRTGKVRAALLAYVAEPVPATPEELAERFGLSSVALRRAIGEDGVADHRDQWQAEQIAASAPASIMAMDDDRAALARDVQKQRERLLPKLQGAYEALAGRIAEEAGEVPLSMVSSLKTLRQEIDRITGGDALAKVEAELLLREAKSLGEDPGTFRPSDAFDPFALPEKE